MKREFGEVGAVWLEDFEGRGVWRGDAFPQTSLLQIGGPLEKWVLLLFFQTKMPLSFEYITHISYYIH